MTSILAPFFLPLHANTFKLQKFHVHCVGFAAPRISGTLRIRRRWLGLLAAFFLLQTAYNTKADAGAAELSTNIKHVTYLST